MAYLRVPVAPYEFGEMIMSVVNVSVAIPDADRFEGAVSEAKKVGLKVDNALEVLGVVTGSIEEKSLPALHRVQGIDSVEMSRDYSIPQPVSGHRP
jgi:hypothetical protein